MVGKWMIRAVVFTGAAILGLSANGRADEAARAVVMTEALAVYARASQEGSPVAGLVLGEAVQVKVEMLGAGADGPWCGIIRPGETSIAGFVQCRHLERGGGPEQEWQLLGDPSSSPQAPMTSSAMIKNNQVLLPVVLRNGWKKEEVLLLLDTGAARTVIHAEAASRLKIPTGRAEKGLARVADGSLVPIRKARIDDLAVGPHVLKDMEIMIMDHTGRADHEGLLGMDVLRGLRYRIDFEGQEIIWQ